MLKFLFYIKKDKRMDNSVFNNSEQILFEGMTSLSALINAERRGTSRRKILKVYFEKSKIRKERGRFTFIKNAAEDIGFELEVVDEECIEKLATGKTHGGILALATEATYKSLTDDSIDKDGFVVILDGIEDPYSLAYSLRTVYACGADRVILPTRLPSGSDALVCRSSAGASELLDIRLSDSLEAALAYKEKGYTIVSAAIPNSSLCYEADLKKPLLLIIGGEKRGISSKLLEVSDINIRIPYGGDFMGSLSTTSAVSILAYEVLRQNSK